LLDWLYTAISFVMKQWHALFSTFLDPAGGITWALAIMFLVVTVRLLLFPLFVKQIKSQRAMQELQPEIAKPVPWSAPCFATASRAYALHEG